MDVNPDHPLALQAYTTFRVPGGLWEASLIFVVVAIVLNTVWEAVTATGSFAQSPGLMRAAVVAGIVYLAVRCARAGLNHRRRRGGIGPAVERIEP